MKETEKLTEEAKREIDKCYCPYSQFHVVAILKATDGKKFTGVNIENGSFGLTICAERVAFFKALSEGKRKFSEIFIYSPDNMPYPCGACRQVMSEFCSSEFKIIVATKGKTEQMNLGEILPFSFNFKNT